MTNSMTAFARRSDEQAWGTLVWELRSVNHRYLDVSFKLPEELRALENDIRNLLAQSIKRGKVECNLRFRPSVTQQSELHVNESYADAVLKACLLISKRLHQPSEMNVIEILKWPGVVEEPEADLKPVMAAATELFTRALEDLCAMRKDEGQRLQVMLETRCAAMKEIVAGLKGRRGEIAENVRNRIRTRIEELSVGYDKDRFEQEVVYLLQKIDIDEELDRLESHLQEIETIFERDEPIGRRLDFLMQEFNREANTLGSKSSEIETTQAAVELKVLIEQMREQVQNIE